MKTKGQEIVEKVNAYLKDHQDSSVAAACKSLGFKGHQYYNANNALKNKKKARATTQAQVKRPKTRTQATVSSPTLSIPNLKTTGRLSMLIVGDSLAIAEIARLLNQ